MTKIHATFLSLATLFLLSSCIFIIEPEKDSNLGTQRTFRAINTSNKTWYDCPSTLRAIGNRVLVYVESTSDITYMQARAIAYEFDTNIYTKITGAFGAESDVDGNGKIIILLLDIKDDYVAPSGGYVAGYFDSTHEFQYDVIENPNSNEADMIFMDINPLEPGSSDFYETIAHEFQHLINFTNTYLVDGRQQDIWINEGLSSAAEYIYSGEQIEWKIDYYNNNNNLNQSGTIARGNNFFVWYGYWELEDESRDQLANYSTVYLFFQWLRIHASNGTGIYKEILASNFRDYQAVTGSARLRIDEKFDEWSELLGTWMMANILEETDGYRGYKGQISVVAPGNNITTTADEYLAPGEAIFAPDVITQSFTPDSSGSNIIYIGLSEYGTEDRLGPSYDGTRILVFNSNNDYEGNYELSKIPASNPLPPASIMRAVAGGGGLLERYKIDVRFGPGGGLALPGPVKGKPSAEKLGTK